MEVLKPGKFIHLHKAMFLKNFILSKHGCEKFSDKIFCEFDHGTDSRGAIVPMIFTGKYFFWNSDDCQQLTGEMMHYVISEWKSDPMKKVVFASDNCVVLSPFFISDVLGIDNMKSAKKFNLELAIVNFPKFVRQGEDLLKAKLILMPYCKTIPNSKVNHHVVMSSTSTTS